MPTAGTTLKLAGFMGLSLVAHGLLLVIEAQQELKPHPAPIGLPALNVSLVTPDDKTTNMTRTDITRPPRPIQTVPSVSTEKQPGRANSPTPRNRVKPAAQSVAMTFMEPGAPADKPGTNLGTQAANPVQAVNPAQAANPAQAVTVSQQETLQSAQRNFLLGEIYNRLSQYLDYPDRARRRGWEGAVMIGFNVDKQGFLHNVHLTRTSGYNLLDNAALSAVKKVNNIPVNEWGSVFKPVALQLPVIYRLTRS